MIKINISGQLKNEIENEHINYFENVKPKNSSKPYRDILYNFILNSKGQERDLAIYLLNNYKYIICGQPNKLQEIVDDINKSPKNILDKILHEESDLHRLIARVFNYESFRNRADSKWGAYQFVGKLGVNVCPYCNRQFITTYHSKDGKARATLDHFFSKEKYPYLAISLYNLIPCCAICNSSFKGKKEVSYKNFINPYSEEFGNDLKFSIKPTRPKGGQEKEYDFLSALSGSGTNFDIVLKENRNGNWQTIKKAQKSAALFHIEDIYNFHKDYVQELIKKAIVYNESLIKQLHTDYSELFPTKKELLRMIIANYISEDELDKRVLSKMMKDIAEELGLLKYLAE